MKEWLNYKFARYPKLYEKVLRCRKPCNFEKVVFVNLVRNGDVVFDLGANRGYYTTLFSHLVGRKGEVHAFEPVPVTFDHLSTSVLQAKRFENIELNNLAVGDYQGIVNLYMPNLDDGQASMAKHSTGSWQDITKVRKFECQIVKLDDYITSKNMKRLDFIKCDLEGAELLALKGLAKGIVEFKPLIHLEICADWTKDFNYTPVEIVNYLSSLGYGAFFLVTDDLHSLDNPIVDLLPDNFSGSANLLCAIPELHASRINRLL
jgi:FkbM family methyltransferase